MTAGTRNRHQYRAAARSVHTAVAASVVDPIAGMAGPAALISLGMALRKYGISGNIGISACMSVLKLVLLPASVWAASRILGLTPEWTAAMVLTSAVPTGVNAWLIANRFGVGHSWHDVKTDRSVAFGGFADKLSASYDASTTYAFGEVGYAMVMDRVTFEPFANVAFVHLDTDGFTESGGPAALTSNGETRNIPYTTLGLRAGTDMLLGGTTLRLDGMVGWQHAYNNVVPGESFALKGSDLFNVSGMPIARDAFLLEAGTSWRPADNVTLGLTYSGQFASGSRDHGFKGTLSVKF